MIGTDLRDTRLKSLRQCRDRYFADLGLEVFRAPPNASELEDEWITASLRKANATGDTASVEMLQGYLDGTRARPVVGTTEHVCAPYRDAIEKRIGASAVLPHLQSAVLVDEFPTGTFNAQVTREDAGFIVLLNAGTNVLLTHFAAAAMRRGDEELAEDEARFLADVVEGYVRGHDLLSLPAPTPRDMISFAVSGALTRALKTFCIAHEYGHIISGHLSAASPAANSPGYLAKSHAQEFEADLVAAKILLGDAWPGVEGQEVYDRLERDSIEPHDLRAAIELSASVSAPALFFAIDHMVARAQDYAGVSTSAPSTHPAALDRFAAVMEPTVPGLSKHATKWWAFAAEVRQLADDRFEID